MGSSRRFVWDRSRRFGEKIAIYSGKNWGPRSDTRKNFSCDVVVRLKGGAYVTNESGRESAECCAGPRRLRGWIRMGRRLQRGIASVRGRATPDEERALGGESWH